MMTKRWMPITAAALISVGVLSGCSSDEPAPPPEGSDASSSSAQAAGAPTGDGRELADWAVTTFLGRESTDVCQYGTEDLLIAFGEHGWCENDVDFKQTPVKLTLTSEWDQTSSAGNAVAGTEYEYVVEPSIDFEGDGQARNTIIVTVSDASGDWLIGRLQPVTHDLSAEVNKPELDENIELD